jgi:hypothetical protein
MTATPTNSGHAPTAWRTGKIGPELSVADAAARAASALVARRIGPLLDPKATSG